MKLTDALSSKYGFVPGWRISEEVLHKVTVGHQDIFLSGLVGVSKSGKSIFGSAGSTVDYPIDRAFFELVERIATIESSGNESPRNGLGRIIDLDFKDLPALGNEAAYSKSNGVALGKSFEEAAQKAYLELVERDDILRAWYGASKPRIINKKPSTLSEIQGEYQVIAVDFTNDPAEGFTIGAFGFPKNRKRPLIYGFGCSQNVERAFEKSQQEALQRLGFLWDEELPQAVDFSPTAGFHQDFFLMPEKVEVIRRWIFEGHSDQGLDVPHESNTHYLDLTPPKGINGLYVVKAVSNSKIPLVFGEWNPVVSRRSDRNLIYHPIA